MSRGNTGAELRKRLLYLADGAAEVWSSIRRPSTVLVSRAEGAAIAVDPIVDYHCELIPIVVTPEYRTPSA